MLSVTTNGRSFAGRGGVSEGGPGAGTTRVRCFLVFGVWVCWGEAGLLCLFLFSGRVKEGQSTERYRNTMEIHVIESTIDCDELARQNHKPRGTRHGDRTGSSLDRGRGPDNARDPRASDSAAPMERWCWTSRNIGFGCIWYLFGGDVVKCHRRPQDMWYCTRLL